MAHLIEAESFHSVWSKLIYGILNAGIVVSPRGLKTKELTNVTINVTNGLANILFSQKRDLNYRFMVAEWIWIQSGSGDLLSLEQYNSVMKQFSDDGGTLTGAYGPRLKPQWEYIFENLKKPASRQAVSSIWSPSPESSRDIPCTLSLQWLIRNDCVNCTINMRSSDAWLGLVYDFFNFSMLTNVVSNSFNLPVGSITMNLASSHLYEQHWELAKSIFTNEIVYTIKSPQFKGIKIPVEEDLRSILLNPQEDFSSLGWPWTEYAKSLYGKKFHCLEVLRGLAR